MDPMQMMMLQRYMQQRKGAGMFGAQPQGQPAMQPQMMAGMPTQAPQQMPQTPPGPGGQATGGDDHHSKLRQMLPYLGMGLLPMLLGGLGGGGMGQMASMISPLAFGLHKAKVF